MERLYEKLQEYSGTDMYGFHMPGHKRKPLLHHCYEIDITEIDGFDDMHHPEGLLKEFQSYMQDIYHTRGSYFLVNGSTGGILAAISAATELGGELLAARNCHKSVYNAAYLRNLKTHYIYPQYDEKWGIFTTISPEDVDKNMKLYPSCKTVMIVSPTYEGVVSDITGIAEVVHRHGGTLIVDEAHGAHFPYLEAFPKSAIACGADIVIQSVHKTLPSLTQTALLHVCGKEGLQKKVERCLSIYQSSSPSYVFLSSIEECVLWMEENKNTVGNVYTKELQKLRQDIKNLKRIELYEPCFSASRKEVIHCLTQGEDYDLGKLVLRVRNMENSGKWLYEKLLNEFHIQLEMCLPGHCIAMTSIMDEKKAFARLFDALSSLDKTLAGEHREMDQKCSQERGEKNTSSATECRGIENDMEPLQLRKALDNAFVCSSYEAEFLPMEQMPLSQCEGRVSLETVYVYPPGIPVIVAGERFSRECVQVLQQYCRYGFEIRGLKNHTDSIVGEKSKSTEKNIEITICVSRED